jgi:hypothetical protein
MAFLVMRPERLSGARRAPGGEPHVGGLAALHVARHQRLERGVHHRLDAGQRAEAGRELDELRAVPQQVALDALVQRHVGASEAIDALLRITDHEQLARQRARLERLALVRAIGREQQQDLGLHRIGVLELIDEHMADALL